MTAYVPGTDERDLKKIILSLQQLAAGRSNAVGRVTLATGSATTIVADDNVSEGSVISLTPLSANAATEMGNGTVYVSSVVNKSFTLTHASSATTGRTFAYAIQG